MVIHIFDFIFTVYTFTIHTKTYTLYIYLSTRDGKQHAESPTLHRAHQLLPNEHLDLIWITSLTSVDVIRTALGRALSRRNNIYKTIYNIQRGGWGGGVLDGIVRTPLQIVPHLRGPISKLSFI